MKVVISATELLNMFMELNVYGWSYTKCRNTLLIFPLLFYSFLIFSSPRVPWTARRFNQSILKEISPGCSLEGLMLRLQYFGHLMRRADSFEKTLMLGKIGGRRRRGQQDEMVGWHHRLNGHGFGWTPGVGDGHGGLACCNSWGCKESDTTERLNWTELKFYRFLDKRG